MRRGFTFLAVVLVLLAVEGALLSGPLLHADLATLAVVYLALEWRVIPGAAVAFGVGYLADVFGAAPRGLHASAMVIVFFVVRLVVSRILGGHAVLITAIGVLATLLSLGTVIGVERVVGPGETSFHALSPAVPWLLGSAAILTYPSYRFFKWVDDRFREPDDEL